jgi:hypothetical protein
MEERWNPASTSKIRSEPQEVLHPQSISGVLRASAHHLPAQAKRRYAPEEIIL